MSGRSIFVVRFQTADHGSGGAFRVPSWRTGERRLREYAAKGVWADLVERREVLAPEYGYGNSPVDIVHVRHTDNGLPCPGEADTPHVVG